VVFKQRRFSPVAADPPAEREEKIPLTQADLDRFHRNAAAALLRRGPGYLWEEALGGLQTAVYGALPIAGLVWWGWSALQMLVFLMVGCWIGILCDTAKVLLLRKRAEAFCETRYNDWHVWVVAGALRDGSRAAAPSHLRAKWAPDAGVFVDFVMGGVSTALIVILLVAEAGLTTESLRTPGVLTSLAALAAVRLAETAWEIFRHRSVDAERAAQVHDGVPAAAIVTDSDRPVKAAVGLRGVGLFLLVFLTAFLTDEDRGVETDVAWVTMLVVNGLVVLYGLLNLTGWLWLRGETLWLRKYLADRAAGKRDPSLTLGSASSEGGDAD
jgi:hypothetical protein